MNKAQLIAKIHEQAGEGLSPEQTAEIVDTILAVIAQSLQQDQRFSVPGFGSFSVRPRAARTGRNLHTGEAIEIPASNAVGFTPAQALKGRLGGGA